MFNDCQSTLARKLRGIALDVNADAILADAREIGLPVYQIADFRYQAEQYHQLEMLMKRYIYLAALGSATSGAATGVGGIGTRLPLRGADIGNMAAQTYRLAQKLAIINGFDPTNPAHDEQITDIYLGALGFDESARETIKTQLFRKEKLTWKNSLYRLKAGRLIFNVAGKLAQKATFRQASRLMPGVSLVAGGVSNYRFADRAADYMLDAFKTAYFAQWHNQDFVS